MFKNSNSDNDTEDGYTRNGRVFREVHLANLFKKNYKEEGFCNGEEADLMDEEHLEPAGTGEWQAEEIRQREPKNLETAQTIEVSTIILLVDSVKLSN